MRALLACVTTVLMWASAGRTSQTDALAISANIQARHMPFGTLLDPIYGSPASDQIVGYTRCGDSALWTGAYLAAESFRYNVTRSADALQNVKSALAGLKALTDLTGDNRLARCIVQANSPYAAGIDRKSTRLNSSHLGISYAVFCLKKKNTQCTYSQRHRPLTARRIIHQF